MTFQFFVQFQPSACTDHLVTTDACGKQIQILQSERKGRRKTCLESQQVASIPHRSPQYLYCVPQANQKPLSLGLGQSSHIPLRAEHCCLEWLVSIPLCEFSESWLC